jgi:pimeloyl-ACP methyl ester carboxylesterase
MQKDLLEFFESHKIKKAILMGHSMGGKTAMLFSYKYPGRVQKLIIVDIAPKEYKNLADYQSLALQHLNILHAIKSIDLAKSLSRREIEKEFLGLVPDTATGNFLLKNLKRFNNNKFKWIINLDAIGNFLPRMLDGLEIIPDKSKIDFQTLFIKGENSNYIKEEDKLQIKELFPGAEFVTIFNAGHMPHIEQQKSFIESVKFFLES